MLAIKCATRLSIRADENAIDHLSICCRYWFNFGVETRSPVLAPFLVPPRSHLLVAMCPLSSKNSSSHPSQNTDMQTNGMAFPTDSFPIANTKQAWNRFPFDAIALVANLLQCRPYWSKLNVWPASLCVKWSRGSARSSVHYAAGASRSSDCAAAKFIAHWRYRRYQVALPKSSSAADRYHRCDYRFDRFATFDSWEHRVAP